MAEDPKPTEIPEPTEAEVLSIMHDDDLVEYRSSSDLSERRRSMFQFYKDQWKAQRAFEEHSKKVKAARDAVNAELAKQSERPAEPEPPLRAPQQTIDWTNDPGIRQMAEDLERQRRDVSAALGNALRGKPLNRPEIHAPHGDDTLGAFLLDNARRSEATLDRFQAEDQERLRSQRGAEETKPPIPEPPRIEFWEEVKKHKGWYLLAFIAWGFPVGLAAIWPMLVRDKTLPEWLAEHGWPSLTALGLSWLAGLCVIAMVIIVRCLLTTRYQTSNPRSVQRARGEQSTPPLTFEVDTEAFRGEVSLGYADEDEAVGLLEATVKLKFWNDDINPGLVRTLKLSIFRLSTSQETEIFDSISKLTFRTGIGESRYFSGLPVPAASPTEDYWFHFQGYVYQDVVGELDRDCVLRLTMFAARQEPYSKDFPVAWWQAKEKHGSYLQLPLK